MPRKRAIPVTVSYSCNECGAPAYTSGPGQTSKIYVNHTKACKLALEIMLQWPQLAESTGLAEWMTGGQNVRTFEFAEAAG
jgi:hypothetical protein